MSLVRIFIWLLVSSLIACTSESINIDRLESLPCESSIAILDSINEVNPKFFDKDVYLYYQYSYCLGTNGRIEEAIDPMLIYLNHFPKDLNAKMILGYFYNSSGKIDYALKQFIEVRNADSVYGDVNYNIAIAYFNQKQFKNSLRYIDLQLKNTQDRDIEAESFKGEILVKLQKWELAIECYNKIPLDAFDNSGMKFYLKALKHLNKYADAEQFLINLAIKNPNQFDIYNELALVAIENGSLVRAKAYLHKSKDLEQNAKENPDLYFAYSKYYFSLDNLDSCCYFVEHYLSDSLDYPGYDTLKVQCCE